MTTRKSSIHESDAELERLLEEAEPRPMPSAEAMQLARLAVKDEWRQITGRHRAARRLRAFAAAAGFVLAVAVAMYAVLTPQPAAIEVATVERASGAVYILGEQSRLERTDGVASFTTGQTIVTGDSATLGLRWGDGGSLRVNERTEITFVSADRVQLESGELYFDSVSPSGDEVMLTIGTPHGDVRHVGTQFLTATDRDALTIRVREGRVEVEGRFYDARALEGEMLQIRGSQRPHTTSTTIYGVHWEWIETAAPTVMMEGRTLGAFLDWIERETGLEVVFENRDIKTVVIDETMTGEVSEAPRVALRQRLLTYDLGFEEHAGLIVIRPLDP